MQMGRRSGRWMARCMRAQVFGSLAHSCGKSPSNHGDVGPNYVSSTNQTLLSPHAEESFERPNCDVGFIQLLCSPIEFRRLTSATRLSVKTVSVNMSLVA